jgi:SAM-dependent methyltransferase
MFTDNVRGIYAKSKAAYLESKGYVVPVRYQSQFVHCGGAVDVQYIFTKFMEGLPARSRVLVVGPFGGRDYFLCANLGYEAVAVDLGPQPEIDNLVIHNVEEPLPFAAESFEAVIAAEILEHLVWDVQALSNLRQVLKPNGRLLVSLPFYHDQQPTHLRIHSPESGRRMLRQAGFTVIDYLERPAIFWMRPLNSLVHLLIIVLYMLTGKTLYKWTTLWFSRFEYRVGHMSWPRRFRRLSSLYGGYYLCRKSVQIPNYLEQNAKHYTNGGEVAWLVPQNESSSLS